MDKKHKQRKGGKTHVPAADSFTNYDCAGWMSRLYNDGWLKKRWRKRYCVLSNGILYIYEKQAAKGTEAGSIAIDLAKFSSCSKATGKESKKSPNTIILEPTVSNNDNGEKDQNNNVARECFFTDDATDIDKWMLKLKESLSLSIKGDKAKLEHVTKSRARPPRGGGGNRRPPTKQHIKERARMSEIVMDDEQDQPRKSARESRGRIPATAMKPNSKPILPNLSRNVNKKVDAENSSVDAQNSSVDAQNSSVGDEVDVTNISQPETDTPDCVKTESSAPKLPPVALKPKSKPTDNSSELKSEEPDGSSERSEENLTGSESSDASVNQSAGDTLELSQNKTKSPPKLPPVAMKPKFTPSESVENDDENESTGDTDSESSITESEPFVEASSSSSIPKESPTTHNQPPALPPKPKLSPEKCNPPVNDEITIKDSTNINSDALVISDLGDSVHHNEVIENATNGNPDSSISKSLSNLKLSYEHKNNTQSKNWSQTF